jgi:hypothetical protein
LCPKLRSELSDPGENVDAVIVSGHEDITLCVVANLYVPVGCHENSLGLLLSPIVAPPEDTEIRLLRTRSDDEADDWEQVMPLTAKPGDDSGNMGFEVLEHFGKPFSLLGVIQCPVKGFADFILIRMGFFTFVLRFLQGVINFFAVRRRKWGQELGKSRQCGLYVNLLGEDNCTRS